MCDEFTIGLHFLVFGIDFERIEKEWLHGKKK